MIQIQYFNDRFDIQTLVGKSESNAEIGEYMQLYINLHLKGFILYK